MALVAQSTASDVIAQLRHERDELRARNAALVAELEALRANTTTAGDNRPKLTAADVANIRELAGQPGWRQATIAAIYGINPATVSRIVRHQYHP